MTNSRTIAVEFEQYRESLCAIGRNRLRGRVVSKVDIPGVVQETFLEAHQQADNWRNNDPRVRAAWIHRAFNNNLVDEIRRFRRQSRDVARERSIDDETRDRASAISLVASEPSPDEVAVRREHTTHLSAALQRLPDVQRQAVELHHLRGLTLTEVAKKLNRTKGAVAGLIYRGLQRLRVLLQELIMVEA
jgi:RNA polymerase sigma-70 factor (ECF subfamily)